MHTINGRILLRTYVQGRQETHNYKNNDVRTSGNSRISMSHETEKSVFRLRRKWWAI